MFQESLRGYMDNIFRIFCCCHITVFNQITFPLMLRNIFSRVLSILTILTIVIETACFHFNGLKRFQSNLKLKMVEISELEEDDWRGFQDGFDWQLERARRLLEGPSFAPIRMTLWQPNQRQTSSPPGFLDQSKILLNNVLSMVGIAESLDGAPVVQGVNTFKGDPIQLLARVIDGNLAELAGGPLFLLLNTYYKQYGPVYKLAFGILELF